MEIKLALKVNDKDNVATIFANGITDGTEVEIRDKKGNAETDRKSTRLNSSHSRKSRMPSSA